MKNKKYIEVMTMENILKGILKIVFSIALFVSVFTIFFSLDCFLYKGGPIILLFIILGNLYISWRALLFYWEGALDLFSKQKIEIKESD